MKVILETRDIFLLGFPLSPFWYAHHIQAVCVSQWFFLQHTQQASLHYFRKKYTMWFLLQESEKLNFWSSAWRKIYLHIDGKIYFSYFSFIFTCFQYMESSTVISWFWKFLPVSIWVPTCFPEVICSRYGTASFPFSHVARLIGRLVYWFGHPNFGTQNNTNFSFFRCISKKKKFEVAVNDFIVHWIIWKWLRRQKWVIPERMSWGHVISRDFEKIQHGNSKGQL